MTRIAIHLTGIRRWSIY